MLKPSEDDCVRTHNVQINIYVLNIQRNVYYENLLSKDCGRRSLHQ